MRRVEGGSTREISGLLVLLDKRVGGFCTFGGLREDTSKALLL
jgi:hypothetical protein